MNLVENLTQNSERLLMTEKERYDCDCEKEDSLKWIEYVKKGSIIFWISATVVGITLTVLYHLGVRP